MAAAYEQELGDALRGWRHAMDTAGRDPFIVAYVGDSSRRAVDALISRRDVPAATREELEAFVSSVERQNLIKNAATKGKALAAGAGITLAVALGWAAALGRKAWSTGQGAAAKIGWLVVACYLLWVIGNGLKEALSWAPPPGLVAVKKAERPLYDMLGVSPPVLTTDRLTRLAGNAVGIVVSTGVALLLLAGFAALVPDPVEIPSPTIPTPTSTDICEILDTC